MYLAHAEKVHLVVYLSALIGSGLKIPQLVGFSIQFSANGLLCGRARTGWFKLVGDRGL
jgi:hypothetical protein